MKLSELDPADVTSAAPVKLRLSDLQPADVSASKPAGFFAPSQPSWQSDAKPTAPDDQIVSSALDAAKYVGNGIKGAVIGAGKGLLGFGDRIGAGINAATGPETYDTYLALGRQAYHENEQENPVMSRVGEVGAAAATPIGKISGAVGAAKVAGLGAAQGVGSAPDLTDTSDVAKRAAVGLGTGLLLHGAVSGVKSLATPELAADLTQRANQHLVEGALNPTKPQMAALQAKDKVQGLGQAVYDAGAGKPWDTAAATSEKLGTAVDDVGQKLDAIYKSAHGAAAEDAITGNDIQNVVRGHITDLNKSASTRPMARKLQTYLSDVQDTYGDGPLTLDQARDEVSNLQNAFDTGGVNPGAAQQTVRDLSMRMRQMLNSKIEAAVPDSGIAGTNQNISQLLTADKLANSNAAGAQSNRMFGIGDTRMAAVGATVGAHGGPIGAAVGAAVGGLGSKVLRTFGKQTLAAGERSLASAAEALAGQLDAGTPVAKIIQRATAIGIPKAVVDQLSTQGPQQ